MPRQHLNPDQVLKAARDKHVLFVNLQFTDIVGMVKSVTVPIGHLENALQNGVWFDGSSVEGFARVSESDMFLRPDPDTFAIIPWTDGGHKTARLICNVYTPDGDRFLGSPRTALIVALEEAEEMGFEFYAGPELEFFLFEMDGSGNPLPGATHDKASYFDATADRGTAVRQDMVTALEAFGIDVETAHHELAIGQHEIDFRYDRALAAADNAVTFKYVLKAVAAQHGAYATFMPKPIRGIAGSGMHVHQSLNYVGSEGNAFADCDDPYGLSTLAKQFMAGQIAHAKGMTAILAPLVNSYKRLVAGYEAPVYVSWARINRSALIRVPRFPCPESTRIELRCPDPACNPYLAFAVMLKAGLDGIRNEMTLPEATEENLFESEWARQGLETLPGSLRDALDEMERDPLIQDALGPHIYERFMDAKMQEWEDYRLSVTQWELDRYLSRF
jgi:glutamine synthetase